jgi:hypothetical protein
MADDAQTAENDDTAALDALEQGSAAAGEMPAAGETTSAEGAEGAATAEQADEGELVVTIGDEAPAEEEADPQQAPAWVKELRKSNREKDRRIRELEAKVATVAPAPVEVVVGLKPTLASCEYDEDKFAADLEAWHDRKRQADEAKAQQETASRKSQEQWQAKLAGYGAGKTALRVSDFEDAEEQVLQTLNAVQQGIIVQGVKNPALVVYALGKNPKKAKELAAITDPVVFAVAIGELGAQLKVSSRKPATLPEKTAPRSSMSGASAVDDQLAKLQAHAEKTGDRTPVVRYLQGKQKQTA